MGPCRGHVQYNILENLWLCVVCVWCVCGIFMGNSFDERLLLLYDSALGQQRGLGRAGAGAVGFPSPLSRHLVYFMYMYSSTSYM